MSGIDTGGSAFPCDRHATDANNGMTLRDYFAVRAMQSLITGRTWDHFKGTDKELIAQWAKSSYVVADAMLAARSGGGV